MILHSTRTRLLESTVNESLRCFKLFILLEFVLLNLTNRRCIPNTNSCVFAGRMLLLRLLKQTTRQTSSTMYMMELQIIQPLLDTQLTRLTTITPLLNGLATALHSNRYVCEPRLHYQSFCDHSKHR